REGRDGGERREAARENGPSLALAWGLAMDPGGQWQSVQIRLPDGGPVSLIVSETGAFRPDQRTTITVSREGKVERRAYADLDPARRVRAWMRPLHTGEVAGIPGQTLAALVSLAAAVLVWTGLALAWRRLLVKSRVESRGSSVRKVGVGTRWRPSGPSTLDSGR
ncbi:MAG TPA: PepSY domain-containing protein, partial [Gemmatimonadales bacterium]|nr:PepSY domain-containing protein [Gemmatimonadales bacterium]